MCRRIIGSCGTEKKIKGVFIILSNAYAAVITFTELIKCFGNSGIGGFANITAATPVIVFCSTFTTKGLEAVEEDGQIKILREGSIRKIKKDVSAISFSAKNALLNGQKVLYVTERCVFELTEQGLRLKEVYPGIDEQTQIRDLLDFELV